ncbi:hypothetical protein L6164_011520 [Bauhinia variegata]|uniref:Uncharacterized protein n=1 Tax=Bauhinia variegata TaxID=167791 RepID=A0ACB9P8S5_BAUVA|nr:hypothetical protein L6164_011520 [Bauhinia variegata]
MDVGRRTGVRSSVVAGSVWESRMKSDEVRGGIKVFNGDENPEEAQNGGTRLRRSLTGGAVNSGKRKNRKSESYDIQIARGKTEPQKNSDEQCKELSISSDAVKKSPIQPRKLKTDASKDIGVSADKLERSPIQTRRLRSEMSKGTTELDKEANESADGAESSPGLLRKSKSDSIRTANQSVKAVAGSANGNEENSVKLRKTKSESKKADLIDGPDGGIEKIPVEIVSNEKDDRDENCKDFGVCLEKVISTSSSSGNVGEVKCSPELSAAFDGNPDAGLGDEVDERDEVEGEMDEEIEIESEKDSFDVKEISIPESKVVKESENNKLEKESENKKIITEPERKKIVNEQRIDKVVNEPEPKKIVNSYSRFRQNNERQTSTPVTVKQSPPTPIKRHSTNYQNSSKANPTPKTEEFHTFPQTQSKLQSLVDLIMWRDISRSAFVFGIGTFIIISSSYAQDINVSFISVISYLGLVYLAVIFLYRSIICRGFIDVDDTSYVLGEEEAIWVLRLILPYLNELLAKLRALFSGDPGTTIKLALLLFALARCGSSITIWKMAKFGFFGVFTLPKVCSSYSTQLTAYGNFWVRRFRDAWHSCSHKKAVALSIFGLVWNLSSVVARIWAVFLLFVAFKYYQQHYLVRDQDWVDEDDEQVPVGVLHRQGGASNSAQPLNNKLKKGI